MRTILVLIVLLIFSKSVTAQQKIENAAMLTLKNGSKITGTVISETDDKYVLLVGEIDTLSISKIQVKKYYEPEDNAVFNKNKYHRLSGLNLKYDFGLGFSGEGYTSSQFGLYYKFNPKWELGIGFAGKASTYTLDLQGEFFSLSFPSTVLFTQARYYFTSTKVRPFLQAQIGYAFGQNSWNVIEYDHGIQYGYGLGCAFPSKKRYKWYTTLALDGYTVNRVFEVDHRDVLSDVNYKGSMNAVVLSVGVEFGR